MADDVIEMIEQDHREVERLFDQLLSGSGDRGEIAHQICIELAAHSRYEEEVVYPAIEASIPDGEDKVHEGVEEHNQARDLCARLNGLAADDPTFDTVVMELQDAVNHHVQEEESEILPPFRERSSADERARLAEQAMAVKLAATDTEEATVEADANTELSEATKEELYEQAKELDVSGRSKMNKDELAQAVAEERGA